MGRSAPISGIDAEARRLIRGYGLTVRQYVQHFRGDLTRWPGDSCGCPDDRCRGYHHAEDDPCGCLPALLEDLT